MARKFTRSEISNLTRNWITSAEREVSKRDWQAVISLIEDSSFDRWSAMSDSEKYAVEEWVKSELPNAKPIE